MGITGHEMVMRALHHVLNRPVDGWGLQCIDRIVRDLSANPSPTESQAYDICDRLQDIGFGVDLDTPEAFYRWCNGHPIFSCYA